MTIEERNSFYENCDWVNRFNSYLKTNPSNIAEQQVMNLWIKDLNGERALELGCAGALYGNLLLKQFDILDVVDLSEPIINYARERLDERVRFHKHDLNLVFPDFDKDTFDAVLSSFVLHYLSDLNKLFKSVNWVLKTGGFFIFSIIHPDYFPESSKIINEDPRIIKDVWLELEVESLRFHVDLNVLRNIIQTNGFDIIEEEIPLFSSSGKQNGDEFYSICFKLVKVG